MSDSAADRTFEPITSQADFDERIKNRLAREREKWEKESSTEDLKSQLEAKDAQMAELKKSHDLENARHAALQELMKRGVRDEGRRERIMRLVDLEGEAEPAAQLDALSRDVPELFKVPVGAGSGGSKQPVLDTGDKPLTREEVGAMSPDEINSRWDTVRKFLAGERS